MAQRFDWIERGRFPRWIQPKAHADHAANRHTGQSPAPRENQFRVENRTSGVASGDSNQNSNQASHQRQRDRFAKKLGENTFLSRADTFTHPNFFRPLGHAHQHDVHDSDSGSDEGKRADHKRADADHIGNFC